MAYKGHLRQPPQSYILTNIQRFKSKRGPLGSFRRETALRTKHITPGHTFLLNLKFLDIAEGAK